MRALKKLLLGFLISASYAFFLWYFDMPVGINQIGARTGKPLFEQPDLPFWQEMGEIGKIFLGVLIFLVFTWCVVRLLAPEEMRFFKPKR